jgi:CRISPR system Cascade subunit CasB
MGNDKSWLNFTLGERAASVLENWWRDLNPKEKAELRRSEGPVQVVFNPAYHRLLNELRGEGYGIDQDKLAMVAGLSGHVKENRHKKIAVQLGEGLGEKEKAKNLRFRRLLEIQESDELYLPLIRVIHLLKNSADLLDLANSVYWWNERTRKRWARDFYNGVSSEEIEKEKEAVS